jgi:hypothetical protein
LPFFTFYHNQVSDYSLATGKFYLGAGKLDCATLCLQFPDCSAFSISPIDNDCGLNRDVDSIYPFDGFDTYTRTNLTNLTGAEGYWTIFV